MAMEVQIWSGGNTPRNARDEQDEQGSSGAWGGERGAACDGRGSATQIKNSSIFNAYSVKAAHEAGAS